MLTSLSPMEIFLLAIGVWWIVHPRSAARLNGRLLTWWRQHIDRAFGMATHVIDEAQFDKGTRALGIMLLLVVLMVQVLRLKLPSQ